MSVKVDLIVKGGPVLTFDENDSIYINGLVAVDDGNIVFVGEEMDATEEYIADDTVDVEGDLIMPGLINGHTHAAMSVMRGYADDLPLDRWLEDYIFPAENMLMSDEMVSTKWSTGGRSCQPRR
jgi:5-methylthioadenosine/S-adenosylhomocysteine deaminase